jgi:hypothetical protein
MTVQRETNQCVEKCGDEFRLHIELSRSFCIQLNGQLHRHESRTLARPCGPTDKEKAGAKAGWQKGL